MQQNSTTITTGQTNPRCVKCPLECQERTSHSEKNPNRQYWHCTEHGFSQWVSGLPTTPTPKKGASSSSSSLLFKDRVGSGEPRSPSQRYSPYNKQRLGLPTQQQGQGALAQYSARSRMAEQSVVPPSYTPFQTNVFDFADENGAKDEEDEKVDTVIDKTMQSFNSVLETASRTMQSVVTKNRRLTEENRKLKAENGNLKAKINELKDESRGSLLSEGKGAGEHDYKEEITRLRVQITALKAAINAMSN
ncbi:hypothetical protein HK100_001310 [Physocladia obscura]|uniref:Uncharacterized protein n=1 Tax=Physocladia obscura TaxID=109957 RepID=A0AAD5SXB2_9FUNG|nr:hypothetical protein HK100_001310 [Physocladia obscura]